MESFEKGKGVVRTKRLWLFATALAFALLSFAPMLEAIFRAIAGQWPGWLAIPLYYGVFFALLYAFNKRWLERRGRLRADETGLWLGDECIVRRSSLRHGYVLQREGRAYVRLGRMMRQVDVEVASVAEGEAMLAAMRLDPASSVAHYPMTDGTYARSIAVAVGIFVTMSSAFVAPAFFGASIPWFGAALLVATAAVLGVSLHQFLRVSVGADGVRIRRLFQRARFVPFGAIEQAETLGRDITIRLRDGSVIVMHHPSGRKQGSSETWPFHAMVDRALDGFKLVDRINQQVTAHGAQAPVEASTFARGGRTTHEWLRDVAGVADVNATYRSPAVPPDELWRIVEDATAPTSARAGAAVALRQVLDDKGRVRLHAVADACAAPRLRVALETVASEREGRESREDLSDALDVLEDEPVVRRATMPRRP